MADDSACDAILDLLERMENARWSSKVALAVAKPACPPDHGGAYKFQGAATLTISYRKDLLPEDHWSLGEQRRGVVLTVGRRRLHELRDALTDMKRGGGDYAIGGDEGPLWIWWYIKQSTGAV